MSAPVLRFLRAAGQVKRYHTSRMPSQTLGQHQFGVAWLCYLIVGPQCSAALFLNALGHDLGELATGDVPAPTKRKVEGLGAALDALEAEALADVGLFLPGLTLGEALVLKLADALEGALTCQEEVHAGNSFARPIRAKFLAYVDDLLEHHALASDVRLRVEHLARYASMEFENVG